MYNIIFEVAICVYIFQYTIIIILVKNECELVVEEVKATTLKLGPRTCTENNFCSICLMYYLYIVSVDMRLPYTKCKMFSTSLTYMYIA